MGAVPAGFSLGMRQRLAPAHASHQLDEVERIATHLAVLYAGRVLRQEAVPRLVASLPGTSVFSK